MAEDPCTDIRDALNEQYRQHEAQVAAVEAWAQAIAQVVIAAYTPVMERIAREMDRG